MSNELTYKELIGLIDSVKMCSGCDKVKLVGSHKTFEEVMAMDFPLTDFEYEELEPSPESPLEFNESTLYIIPIDDLRG